MSTGLVYYKTRRLDPKEGGGEGGYMAQLYSSSASFYYWFWYSFIFSPVCCCCCTLAETNPDIFLFSSVYFSFSFFLKKWREIWIMTPVAFIFDHLHNGGEGGTYPGIYIQQTSRFFVGRIKWGIAALQCLVLMIMISFLLFVILHCRAPCLFFLRPSDVRFFFLFVFFSSSPSCFYRVVTFDV